MRRLGHAGRVDANHVEIVNAIRGRGWSVLALASIGHGCPDLLVAGLGDCLLVEVKNGKKQLTDDQKEFHKKWLGRIEIVRCLEDVGRLFAMIGDRPIPSTAPPAPQPSSSNPSNVGPLFSPR